MIVKTDKEASVEIKQLNKGGTLYSITATYIGGSSENHIIQAKDLHYILINGLRNAKMYDRTYQTDKKESEW